MKSRTHLLTAAFNIVPTPLQGPSSALGSVRSKYFWVFIGNHQNARARIFNFWPFRRMDHAFDSAIHNNFALFHRFNGSPVMLNGKDVPVDLTGTGAICGGVGIWIMQKSAPRS